MTSIANIGTALLQECGYIQDSTSVDVTASMVKAENGYPEDTSYVDVTATLVLDENNYSATDDISKTKTEYLIDNVINYINVQANTTIPALSGTAESKTVSVQRKEATIIKSLTALMIKAYLDRGPNVSIGGLSSASVMNDPQYAVHSDIIKAGISRLQTLSDANVEFIIDNAIGYGNSQTGLQMSLMSGDAGTKTATLTGSQASAVKLIAGILLKVALSRGGEVSLQTVTKDPQYSFYGEMITNVISGLKTIKVDYVENITDDAIKLVNLKAGTSIAALTGAAGSKSLVGTDDEIVVVKIIASEMLRSKLERKEGFELTETMKEAIESLMSVSDDLAFIVAEDDSGID